MAKKKSFEQELQQLQQVVDELERGDLSLDDSLGRFEQGVKHAAHCRALLQQAESKVELLLKDQAGDFILEPLDREHEEA